MSHEKFRPALIKALINYSGRFNLPKQTLINAIIIEAVKLGIPDIPSDEKDQNMILENLLSPELQKKLNISIIIGANNHNIIFHFNKILTSAHFSDSLTKQIINKRKIDNDINENPSKKPRLNSESSDSSDSSESEEKPVANEHGEQMVREGELRSKLEQMKSKIPSPEVQMSIQVQVMPPKIRARLVGCDINGIRTEIKIIKHITKDNVHICYNEKYSVFTVVISPMNNLDDVVKIGGVPLKTGTPPVAIYHGEMLFINNKAYRFEIVY